jgi:hypothetical protein
MPADFAAIQAALEPLVREVEQLRAEVAALRDRVQRLETERAPRPGPPGRRPPEPVPDRAPPKIILGRPAAPPAPEPHDPRDDAPDEFVPAPSPLPAPRAPASQANAADPAWIATLLNRYAEATLDLGGAGERFMADYRPVSTTQSATGDGYNVGGDPHEAMLWAVPAPGGAHALVPGHKAINNWGTSFAANRNTTAAQYFGHAFDLAPGASRLTLTAPALAQERAGILSLVQRGRLTGFRN